MRKPETAGRPLGFSKPHEKELRMICTDSSTISAENLRDILHYDLDTGVFVWKVRPSMRTKTGDVAGTLNSDGYVQIGFRRRKYLAHRLAWLYMYGGWPKQHIDHINRDRTDNRIKNLREVSNAENCQNTDRSSSNKSGHKGVHWHKDTGKWAANVTRNYKTYHLGVFANIEDAIAARKAAEAVHHKFAT
jgi:hypothetical protein